MSASAQPFAARLARVRAAMGDTGVDAVVLSVGADLPWLCGYEAMPLERLTMLVVPRDGDATLVVPALEAPRVVERPGVFALAPWVETVDPLDLAVTMMGPAETVAVGEQTWARFVLGLAERLPSARLVGADQVIGPLRAVKDAHELDELRAAGAAVDRVIASLQRGEVPLVGCSEADIAAELARRLLAEGHRRVNFTIVAAAANAASPHHEATNRIVAPGEVVLCDIGGTFASDPHGVGYCSDITRCVSVGEPSAEVTDAYAALLVAQQAAVVAATVGTTCAQLDAVARDHLTVAGWGDAFIHRTGHGIGVEAHEPPWIVAGNDTELVAGHAFSVEPGIYVPGRFGLRLEDIVVATPDGPLPLNHVSHELVVLDR